MDAAAAGGGGGGGQWTSVAATLACAALLLLGVAAVWKGPIGHSQVMAIWEPVRREEEAEEEAYNEYLERMGHVVEDSKVREEAARWEGILFREFSAKDLRSFLNSSSQMEAVRLARRQV